MSVHYRKLVSNPLLHACQNAPGKNINKYTVIISRYPKKIKYRRLPVHKWRINRDTIRHWIRLLQSLRPKGWGLYLQDLTHSPSARSFGLSVCSYISGLLLVQSFSAYRLRSSSLVAQIYTFAPQTFSLANLHTSRDTACHYKYPRKHLPYRYIYKINSKLAFFLIRT